MCLSEILYVLNVIECSTVVSTYIIENWNKSKIILQSFTEKGTIHFETLMTNSIFIYTRAR